MLGKYHRKKQKEPGTLFRNAKVARHFESGPGHSPQLQRIVMQLHSTSRPARLTLSGCALALALASAALAQPGQRRGPTAPTHPSIGPQKSQEHLAQWMDRHSSLPLPDQQRALEREPGFHDLSPQLQQRMRDRLTQLNNMPPEKRERVMARTEAMEHLDPQQRQQVRGAMNQLSSLPPDRRRAVARTFRELRSLPPDQRQATLNSDRLRSSFTDGERSTLSNLVTIEPYLPPPATSPAPR